MIGQASCGCWRRLQRTVYAAKVVDAEIQPERGFVVRPFLTEGIRQSRQPAILHPHAQVVPLNVARANLVGIRIAENGMPGFVVYSCRFAPGTDHRFVTQ